MTQHIIFFMVTALLTFMFLPLYKRMLIKIKSVDINYMKKQIPVSFGLFIIFIYFLSTQILHIEINLIILASLILMAIIGFYDDYYGDISIKGLKGHMTAFLRGQITSGFIKAASGGIISLFVANYLGLHLFSVLTHFFLILFMINTLNLFDLRPGRALKVFFIFYLMLTFFTPFIYDNASAFIVLGILVILFIEDIHAKIMLGDSGSNLIGLQLGIWISIYFSLMTQWVIITLLFLLHVYTEYYSLTTIIENNKVLNRIDLWGRKRTT